MKRFFAMLLCVCLLLPGMVMAEEDQVEAMLRKGYKYADNGDMLQAMACVEMASWMDEKDLRPELVSAYIYLSMGEYEKALEITDGVIGQAEFWPEAWAIRYCIDIAAGNVEDAQKDMDRLLNLNYQEILETIEEMMASEQDGEAAASAAAVAQADADAYLDAIMASGSAKLTEKRFPGNSVLAQTGPNENLIVIDVSPDGKTALVNLFGALTIVNEDAQIPVRAAENRGVADEYGNLETMLHVVMNQPGKVSVVWSPDGRYASITSSNMVGIGRFYWDPLIIDLQSGEIFLVASYPSDMGEEAWGAVFAACFSRDGRSFYYMVAGRAYEELYSLVCYDLETGGVELCYSGAELGLGSPLWETADGALACSSQSDILMASDTINVYRETDGVWSCKQYPFNPGEEEWRMDAYDVDYTAAGSKVLMRSVDNGMNGSVPAMMRIAQVGDDFAGMEYEWMIRDAEVPTLECVASGSYEATEEFVLSYAMIPQARFSPGGRYVLAVARGEAYDGFVLIDLEAKSLMPVEVPADVNTFRIAVSMSGNFVPGFLWNDDGTIITITDNGVRLFAIE